MQNVVVVGATIQCSHGGKAQLLKGDKRLQISNTAVVTAGQEVGVSFATCPFQAGSIKSPCTATVAATAGVSTLLIIGNAGVLLDNATGKATNANDTSATWKVSNAGQSLLSIDH